MKESKYNCWSTHLVRRKRVCEEVIWCGLRGVGGCWGEGGKGKRSQLSGSVNIFTQLNWRSPFPGDRGRGDGIRPNQLTSWRSTTHSPLFLQHGKAHFIQPQIQKISKNLAGQFNFKYLIALSIVVVHINRQ